MKKTLLLCIFSMLIISVVFGQKADSKLYLTELTPSIEAKQLMNNVIRHSGEEKYLMLTATRSNNAKVLIASVVVKKGSIYPFYLKGHKRLHFFKYKARFVFVTGDSWLYHFFNKTKKVKELLISVQETPSLADSIKVNVQQGLLLHYWYTDGHFKEYNAFSDY